MGIQTRMTPIETVTTAGAGAAITMPWWKNVADMPHLLQALGAVWLLVQITTRLIEFFKRK